MTPQERADNAAGSLGGLVGGSFGTWGWWVGKEWKLPFGLGASPTGNPGRLALWGTRKGDKWGEFPHYHWSVPNPKNPGGSLPKQGLKAHRPYEGGFGFF